MVDGSVYGLVGKSMMMNLRREIIEIAQEDKDRLLYNIS